MAATALNLDFLDLPSEREDNQVVNEVLDIDRFALPVVSNVRLSSQLPMIATLMAVALR